MDRWFRYVAGFPVGRGKLPYSPSGNPGRLQVFVLVPKVVQVVIVAGFQQKHLLLLHQLFELAQTSLGLPVAPVGLEDRAVACRGVFQLVTGNEDIDGKKAHRQPLGVQPFFVVASI